MSTLGKVVTLPLGAVVTDVGPGEANGLVDESLRRCLGDNGQVYVVLARVIRELPETTRRAALR